MVCVKVCTLPCFVPPKVVLSESCVCVDLFCLNAGNQRRFKFLSLDIIPPSLNDVHPALYACILKPMSVLKR